MGIPERPPTRQGLGKPMALVVETLALLPEVGRSGGCLIRFIAHETV
jgi:hypothetical protein